MKKWFSLAMALCMCISFSLVVGAEQPFEPGEIELSVVATELEDGTYSVEYTATTTMVEVLAKAAALYRSHDRMGGFSFICMLHDPLVSQIDTVKEADFTFECVKWGENDVFVFDVAKVTQSGIKITYRINPLVMLEWDNAPTADVKAALTQPMTMKATEIVSADAIAGIDEDFTTHATLHIEGDGIQKYFDMPSVLAAEGDSSMSIVTLGGGDPGTDPGIGEDCPRDERCPAGHFTDLNLQLWYHDGVHYCADEKIMKGMTPTLFEPDTPITRAMIATTLYRIEGSPEIDGVQVFDDVDPTAWYGGPIEWAAENGVVNGYGDGNFGPDDPITREQMAAMLYRYVKEKGYDVTVPEGANLLAYGDSDKISAYAVPAMTWACHVELFKGYEDATLRPTAATRRCEAAVLLYRYCTNILNRAYLGLM